MRGGVDAVRRARVVAQPPPAAPHTSLEDGRDAVAEAALMAQVFHVDGVPDEAAFPLGWCKRTFAGYYAHRNLRRFYLRRWQQNVRAAADERRQTLRAFEHRYVSLCRRAMLVWRAFLRESEQRALMDKRAFHHAAHGVMRRALRSWLARLADTQHQHELETRADRFYVDRRRRRALQQLAQYAAFRRKIGEWQRAATTRARLCWQLWRRRFLKVVYRARVAAFRERWGERRKRLSVIAWRDRARGRSDARLRASLAESFARRHTLERVLARVGLFAKERRRRRAQVQVAERHALLSFRRVHLRAMRRVVGMHRRKLQLVAAAEALHRRSVVVRALHAMTAAGRRIRERDMSQMERVARMCVARAARITRRVFDALASLARGRRLRSQAFESAILAQAARRRRVALLGWFALRRWRVQRREVLANASAHVRAAAVVWTARRALRTILGAYQAALDHRRHVVMAMRFRQHWLLCRQWRAWCAFVARKRQLEQLHDNVAARCALHVRSDAVLLWREALAARRVVLARVAHVAAWHALRTKTGTMKAWRAFVEAQRGRRAQMERVLRERQEFIRGVAVQVILSAGESARLERLRQARLRWSLAAAADFRMLNRAFTGWRRVQLSRTSLRERGLLADGAAVVARAAQTRPAAAKAVGAVPRASSVDAGVRKALFAEPADGLAARTALQPAAAAAALPRLAERAQTRAPDSHSDSAPQRQVHWDVHGARAGIAEAPVPGTTSGAALPLQAIDELESVVAQLTELTERGASDAVAKRLRNELRLRIRTLLAAAQSASTPAV